MDPNSPLYDETITKELSKDGWICPDVDSFLINNDPWLYKEGPGISLALVVNRCDTARRIVKLHKISDYANATECLS